MSGKTSLDQKSNTEEINSGFNPFQNSNLGLKPLPGENSNLKIKPLPGGNSLNHKSKTENLTSNSKFEKLISNPDSKSGWKEESKTLGIGDLQFPNSRILELEERVKKLKRQVKILSEEIVSLNIFYFTAYNSYFFDKITPGKNLKKK